MAVHPQPHEINLHRFVRRELTLVGARSYDRSDFERAVAPGTDSTVPADRLTSDVVPGATARSRRRSPSAA
ncbi:MAG TPA: hypothetical protein VIU15_26805 [Streptomyces sp.]